MAKREKGRNPARFADGVNIPRNAFGMTNADIEMALETGESAGLLQDYFGPAQYDELRNLAREAGSRSVRGGDRVLILPGIMGSKLGYGTFPLGDNIWLDPLDIALGRLTELKIGSGKRIRPQGAILLAYLSLKLRLRIAGFNADFWDYDWRQSLKGLGVQLAATIESSAKPMHLVAHSMGGLVARACFLAEPKNLRRVVMLGTPNLGSYAPVQSFRGTYSVVRKLARLDLRHSLIELVDVFASFPGLIEMIPAPDSGGTSNLFDLANWPTAGQTPAPAALAAAARVQQALPKKMNGVDIVMVAGVQQQTVVNARLDADEFVYTVTDEGDGTVPLRLAELTGAKHFYVAEEHGKLPGNNRIQRALPSLIATGDTIELDRDPPQRRAGLVREYRESETPVPSDAPISVNMPSVAEQRELISELVAPQEVPLSPAAAPANFARTTPSAFAEDAFSQHLIIGRGRERRLELILVHGDITEVDADCYVVGLFKAVAPTGAASALDRAMGGRISNLVARRMFSAEVGEVSVLPNGRRVMRAQNIAFVGLGSIDSFTAETLALVGENVARTFVAAGLDDIAIVPFGGASGADGLNMLRNLLVGFLTGLSDSDSEGRFRSLIICERDTERFDFINRSVRDLSQRPLFDGVELTLREVHLPQRASEPRVPVPATTERIYLLVREAAESEADREVLPPLVASLLTSGDKAAILSGVQPGDPDELQTHLDQLGTFSGLTSARADAYGERLCEIVLAPSLATALKGYKEQHLVVVHDAGASRIPWETLRIDGISPALNGGLSHRYEAPNLSVAKWLERRQLSERLSVLLVIDPTGDLQGARDEGDRIGELLGRLGAAATVKEMRGDRARKNELLQCFSSGAFDVVHYAGHAFFDPDQPSRSGLLCAGREVLSGLDLAGVGNLPMLMFFNACEAARVRGLQDGERNDPPLSEVVRRGTGFAEALLRGGIANFIGTYWPVNDASAEVFAKKFYEKLISGANLNDAVLRGREAVKESQPRPQDWADYVFYGDPDFRLKLQAGDLRPGDGHT